MFRKEVLFIFEKTLADTTFHLPVVEGMDLRIVPNSEFTKFANNFRKLGFDPAILFGSGADLFVAATDNGDLVHWEFVTFKNEVQITEIEKSFRTSLNSAYIYGGYTVPTYRGRGVATAVLEKTFDYLNEKGVYKAYAVTRSNNIPILRVMRKISFEKIGVITFIKIFNWKSYKLKAETHENSKKLTEMFS